MPPREPQRLRPILAVALGVAAILVLITMMLRGPQGNAAPADETPVGQVTLRQVSLKISAEGTLRRSSRLVLSVGDTAPRREDVSSTATGIAAADGSDSGTLAGPASTTAASASAGDATTVAKEVLAFRAAKVSLPSSLLVTAGLPTATTTPSPDPTSTPTPTGTMEPTPTTTTSEPTPTPTSGSSSPKPTTTRQKPAVSPGTPQRGAARPGKISGGSARGSLAAPVAGEAGRDSAPEIGGPDASTLTSLARVGADVDDATVLYRIDGEPVVAMISRPTQWRVLKLGVSNGADVRDLEELLTAAGHGEGLVVDKRFSSITAQRIKDWERDIGRASPDGKVQIGDLVTVPAQHRVLGHLAVLGDEISSGVSVLSLGGEEQAVVVSVPADEVEQWTPGAPAILRWSDGEEGKGTVSGVGRKVSDGAVEVVVDTVSGGKGAGDRATVALVPPISAKVLAVPVAAVMTGPSGAPALQRPDGAYIDVELGTFADGWVEVTGVNEGTQVRLPS